MNLIINLIYNKISRKEKKMETIIILILALFASIIFIIYLFIKNRYQRKSLIETEGYYQAEIKSYKDRDDIKSTLLELSRNSSLSKSSIIFSTISKTRFHKDLINKEDVEPIYADLFIYIRNKITKALVEETSIQSLLKNAINYSFDDNPIDTLDCLNKVLFDFNFNDYVSLYENMVKAEPSIFSSSVECRVFLDIIRKSSRYKGDKIFYDLFTSNLNACIDRGDVKEEVVALLEQDVLMLSEYFKDNKKP